MDEKHPDWVQTQNMGYSPALHPKASSLARFNRNVNREIEKPQVDVPMEVEDLVCDENEIDHITEVKKNVSCQTFVTSASYSEHVSFLRKENANLKEQLQAHDICLKYFKNNNKRTRFYTGEHAPKLKMDLKSLNMSFYFRLIHLYLDANDLQSNQKKLCQGQNFQRKNSQIFAGLKFFSLLW